MQTTTKLPHWRGLALALFQGAAATVAGQTEPTNTTNPIAQATNSLAAVATGPTPAVTPSPPPSPPAKLSAAELEELLAPIALYPDPLIATILPAAVYPLEIVRAAFFLEDTNNLPNLDVQPWDENVKAVAHVPAVIQKMNADLAWTITLGEAFLVQDKEVLEAIQNLRGKAQKAGTLQTTPQQTVVVTNMVSEQTAELKVVVVTNTVVQIQPANPQVVYVPTYNPATVYYPPPTAAAPDPVGSLVTFGAAIAVGAVIANNCDWSGGAVYAGHGGVVVVGGGGSQGNINVNRGNVNSGNVKSGNTVSAQKWQPNQSRLSTSSASSASAAARSADARGWSSAGVSPSATSAGARSATGTSAVRSSPGTPSANRSSSSPSVSQSRGSPSTGSAFGGASSGAGTRSAGSRGASSRSSGGRSGGGGGGRR